MKKNYNNLKINFLQSKNFVGGKNKASIFYF